MHRLVAATRLAPYASTTVAKNQLVVRLVVAYVLQLAAKLVAPEVRHGIVYHWLAGNVRRDRTGAGTFFLSMLDA